MPTKIMPRAIRRAIVRTLIALFLLAQMMVAAYACPRMTSEGADKWMTADATPYGAAAISDAANQTKDMPAGCDGTMVDTANLCAAHCQAGDQATDAAQSFAIPANALSSFYVVQLPSVSSSLDRSSTPSEAIDAHPPPHAILHCCFRI
jgi:hypothetical protein